MFCGETIVPEGLTGLQLSFNFTVRLLGYRTIGMLFLSLPIQIE